MPKLFFFFIYRKLHLNHQLFKVFSVIVAEVEQILHYTLYFVGNIAFLSWKKRMNKKLLICF